MRMLLLFSPSLFLTLFRTLYGDDAKYFEDEIHLQIKHKDKGIVAMANDGKNQNGSKVSFIYDNF